jgi:hypothetical protein
MACVFRAISLALVVLAAAACSTSEETGVTGAAPSSSVPAESGDADPVTPAPGWIKGYCAEAARKIKRSVLCLARTPQGIHPTANLALLQPGRDGYVLEGQAYEHWVFTASTGDLESDYGPMQHLGVTRVREAKGEWLYAPEVAGIHAHHLVLTWRRGSLHYAVSAHTDDPESQSLRRDLRAVAEAMRLYR